MASKELLAIFTSRTLKAENLLRTLKKDLDFLGKVLAYKSDQEKEAATRETVALQSQVRASVAIVPATNKIQLTPALTDYKRPIVI